MVSTYSACLSNGSVVIVHDMPGQTVVSKLDFEQADILREQLARAVESKIAQKECT